LPTAIQGTSQAIEDGTTIALCLKAAGDQGVPLATRSMEKIRYERVNIAQRSGETQRDKWHNAHSEVEAYGEFNAKQGQFLWEQ